MPSSFSRFLSDDELQRVRELYLESLEKDAAEQREAATVAGEPQAGSGDADEPDAAR
jgi:hypothetical protein